MGEVFISYSRRDKDFVRRLGDALVSYRREAWVDWKDIPLTAEWQQEILSNIEAADNFVFVISPDSVASANCKREIEHAVANNKRMVPIFYRTVPDNAIPDSLGRFQRLGFDDDSQFDLNFEALIKALDTDIVWTQAHTRLLTRAKEWERETKDNSFLLRGKDLREAEQWMAKSVDRELKATTLQSQYILSSRQAATKFQRVIFAAVAIAFLIAVGLAVYAFRQKNVAQQQRNLAQQRQTQAEAAKREAEQQRKSADTNATEAKRQQTIANERAAEANKQRNAAVRQANIATSGRLATTALSQAKDGSLDLAALLSVQAINTMDTFEARNALLVTIQSNPMLRAYLHHSNSVVSAAFSPDGKMLASASGTTLHLWDTASWRPLREPAQCNSCSCERCSLRVPDSVDRIAFSPDGKKLALAGGTIIQLWDVASWRPLGDPLEGHTDLINSVAFSPDGKVLVSGSCDQTIRLWTVPDGHPVGNPLTGHKGFVYEVRFSPDGKMLVSAGSDGTMRLWDAASGQPLGEPFHATNVHGMAVSPDGKMLASGSYLQGATVQLWDVDSRRPLGEPLRGHTEEVNGMAFSQNGKVLATASQDSTIRLWDVANRRSIVVLGGHKSSVIAVAFSPDGLLASASLDGTVRIWDLVNPWPLIKLLYRLATRPNREILGGSATERGTDDLQLARSTGVAFSARTKVFVSGGPNYELRLWNVANWQPIGEPLKGYTNEVDSVAFSPDGKMLASGSHDSILRLWDVKSRQPLGGAFEAGTAFCVAFSPDGKMLASASGPTVHLWDVASRRPRGDSLNGHTGGVWSVAFSPDGNTLASASEDKTIRLWNVASGKLIGESFTGHTGAVYGVSFSPDGKMLASGSHDHSVRLRDVASERLLGEPLQGHTGIVESVAFSPNGKMLASASTDKTVRLWDVASQQALGEPLRGHPDRVEHLAFSPDGNTLASAGGDDSVVLWDLKVESWVARLCRLANRNLSLLEWQQYVGSDVPYRRTCPDLPEGKGVRVGRTSN